MVNSSKVNNQILQDFNKIEVDIYRSSSGIPSIPKEGMDMDAAVIPILLYIFSYIKVDSHIA